MDNVNRPNEPSEDPEGPEAVFAQRDIEARIGGCLFSCSIYQSIMDRVEKHYNPEHEEFSRLGRILLAQRLYWNVRFPSEVFPIAKGFFRPRSLDDSYGKPHPCLQCSLEGWPDGDPRCPYVTYCACDENPDHQYFPFRLGMEVSRRAICPVCYNHGKRELMERKAAQEMLAAIRIAKPEHVGQYDLSGYDTTVDDDTEEKEDAVEIQEPSRKSRFGTLSRTLSRMKKSRS